MALRGTGGVEIRLTPNDQARDVTPLVRSFVWRDSLIEGGFSWAMRVTTDGWNEWNDVVLGITNPQIRLMFQSDVESSTPWRTAVVDKSRLSYRSTALTFMLEGADRRLDMMQRDRTRAWLGRSVDEIVNEIGSEWGFNVLTNNTLERIDRWQCREPDWAFLKRLVDGASTASGRGDIFLWLNEDQLTLTAPEVQRPSDRRHSMQEVENRVDRVVLTYNGREVDRKGGATTRAVSFDTDTKQARQFTVDRDAAETHPALARRVPRAPADGLRVYPSTATTPEGVEATARSQWSSVAPRYFALRIDTRPDLALRPGMVLEIQGALGPGKEPPFLGKFLCLEVQHELTTGNPKAKDEGGLVTTAVCYRREAYIGDDEPTGSSAVRQGTRDRYQFGRETRPSTTLVAEVLE